MSIELPGWVVDAFNLVGLPWPGIDEDQLRAWAGGVRAYAAEITALSGSSRSAVAALAASNDSSFGRTLAAQWEHHHTLISDLRGPMEVFAGALDIAADAVEAQKVVVIGAAVVLAGEVIATQGEALVTFGLAEAEVPAEVAIARLAVKAALQELEGQLLGMLINKAAAEISALVGGTVGRLISGGGQVAAEAVTLTADYRAMTTLSKALSGHAGRVEQASSVSWRKAGAGTLEEGGPGGGWREVARAVEQAVLQVLKQLFVDLGRALWTIITDTIAFLKKAITALRHTDDTLANDAKTASGGAGASLAGSDGADAALFSKAASPNLRPTMPMNMETIRRIADKYHIDISELRINIRKESRAYFGATGPDGRTRLGRPAFSSEEQLARTLVHEREHVRQLARGMPYPAVYDPSNEAERAAQKVEDEWWENEGQYLQ
jgi:hypothetical protein